MDQVYDDLGIDYEKGWKNVGDGTIQLQPEIWDPGRFVPTSPGKLWGWYGLTEHAVMKVTFRQSGETAYFDIGSNTHLGQLGGDDHWFFPGEKIVDAKTRSPVECVRKPYLHGSEPNVD